MNKETVSLRKLYNRFKKCPTYESLTYPWYKYFLMSKLMLMKAPGKSITFTFDRGYHDYHQLSVSVLDILKCMKVSKGEFLEWYKKKKTDVPGVLEEI